MMGRDALLRYAEEIYTFICYGMYGFWLGFI